MYKECAGETNPFNFNTAGVDFDGPGQAQIGSNCQLDWLHIEGETFHDLDSDFLTGMKLRPSLEAYFQLCVCLKIQ